MNAVNENPSMLALVLLVGAFVILTAYLNHRRRLMEHRERLIALEKGQPVPPLTPAIPPELLASNPLTPRDILRRGLLWLFFGLGTTAALLITDGNIKKFAFAGLIPAFVGVAYLVFYILDPKRRAEKEQFPPLS